MPVMEASVPLESRIQIGELKPRRLAQYADLSFPESGHHVFSKIVMWSETRIQEQYENGRLSEIAAEWNRERAKWNRPSSRALKFGSREYSSHEE